MSGPGDGKLTSLAVAESGVSERSRGAGRALVTVGDLSTGDGDRGGSNTGVASAGATTFATSVGASDSTSDSSASVDADSSEDEDKWRWVSGLEVAPFVCLSAARIRRAW